MNSEPQLFDEYCCQMLFPPTTDQTQRVVCHESFCRRHTNRPACVTESLQFSWTLIAIQFLLYLQPSSMHEWSRNKHGKFLQKWTVDRYRILSHGCQNKGNYKWINITTMVRGLRYCSPWSQHALNNVSYWLTPIICNSRQLHTFNFLVHSFENSKMKTKRALWWMHGRNWGQLPPAIPL